MDNNNSIYKGLALASFIVSIVSLILSIIPCIGMYAFFPAFIGLIMCLLVFFKAPNISKGFIIAALILSLLSIAVSLVQYFFWHRIPAKIESLKPKFQNVIDSLNSFHYNNYSDFDDENLFDDEIMSSLDSLGELNKKMQEALDSLSND